MGAFVLIVRAVDEPSRAASSRLVACVLYSRPSPSPDWRASSPGASRARVPRRTCGPTTSSGPPCAGRFFVLAVLLLRRVPARAVTALVLGGHGAGRRRGPRRPAEHEHRLGALRLGRHRAGRRRLALRATRPTRASCATCGRTGCSRPTPFTRDDGTIASAAASPTGRSTGRTTPRRATWSARRSTGPRCRRSTRRPPSCTSGACARSSDPTPSTSRCSSPARCSCSA